MITKPFLLIIDGPMGSGKSTIAKLLHPTLPRTAWVGVDRIKWFATNIKRSVKDNAMAYSVALAMADTYARHGMNIFFAQAFMKERGIPVDPIFALAKKYSMRLFIYRLTAPHKILLARALARPQASLAKTPLTKSRILMNLRVYAKQPRLPVPIFDSSKLSAEQIVAIIQKNTLS